MIIKHIKNRLNLLKKTLLLTTLFFYASICFSQNYEGLDYENRAINIGDASSAYENPHTNIVIGKNVYVNITGILSMNAGATITIKPGGLLRITQGSKITSITSGLGNNWGGIIVQGNSFSPNQEADMKFICESNILSCMGDRHGLNPTKNPHLIDDNHCYTNPDNLNNGVLVLGGSSLDGIGTLGGGIIENATTAVTVEPGGLVYCIRSKIINSSVSAISFVGFPIGRFQERSVIKNNEFTTDFTNTTDYIVDNLIYAENRIFYFPIQYNYFTHKINTSGVYVSTKIGLKMLNSCADINNNQFFGFLVGLNNNSFYHKAAVNKITDNSFYENYVSIWGEALDNLVIKKNFIMVNGYDETKSSKLQLPNNPAFPILSGHYATGIQEQDIAQVYAYQNQMIEANSNSIFNSGVCQVNTKIIPNGSTYFQNSNYYKNEISRTLLGIYSYNVVFANYNLKNNSQFSCNKFRSQTTGGYMQNTQSDIFTSGVYLIAQGSNNLSAGNIFSNPPPMEEQFHFSKSPSDPEATYYFDNSNADKNPSVVNVIKIPTFNVNGCADPIETYEIFKPECGAPYMNPIDGGMTHGMSILKNNMGNYKADIVSMELAGIDVSNQDEYDYVRNMYNNDLLQLLEMYYDAMDADTNGLAGINVYYDSISYILKNHVTPYGSYHLLGTALERGNYDDARDYADSLITWYPQFDTSMQQLKDYVGLLSDYAETADSAKFLWMQDNFTTIKTIADDSAHFSSPKAKVWVQYITDIDTSNGYHGYVMYPLDIPFPEMEEEPTVEPEFLVTIYPNPFADDGLQIQVENMTDHLLNYYVKIYDFNGNLINEKPLIIGVSNTETANFDTDSIGSGYYFVRIFEGSTEIHYSLIYK